MIVRGAQDGRHTNGKDSCEQLAQPVAHAAPRCGGHTRYRSRRGERKRRDPRQHGVRQELHHAGPGAAVQALGRLREVHARPGRQLRVRRPGMDAVEDEDRLGQRELLCPLDKKDSRSLSLGASGVATSRPVCVGLEHPTLRFFARNSGLLTSTLTVEVLFETSLGAVLSVPIGVVPALTDDVAANSSAPVGRKPASAAARTRRPRWRSASARSASEATGRSTTSSSIRTGAEAARMAMLGISADGSLIPRSSGSSMTRGRSRGGWEGARG